MARYIDEDKVLETAKDGYHSDFGRSMADITSLREVLEDTPTADVVPKSEVDNLEYTLMGVMHSVDKWLEGDELKQNEVNRAITMREKTLRIIENAKTEVAREIFEEIDLIFRNYYAKCSENKELKLLEPLCQAERFVINEMWHEAAELKKKYTEDINHEDKD